MQVWSEKTLARPGAAAEEVPLGHSSHWAAAALSEAKEELSHLQAGGRCSE